VITTHTGEKGGVGVNLIDKKNNSNNSNHINSINNSDINNNVHSINNHTNHSSNSNIGEDINEMDGYDYLIESDLILSNNNDEDDVLH
jgi:hypothetical protein